MLSKTKVSIRIFDSFDNKISDTYLTSEQGINATLESNSVYTIEIRQVSGIDNYTLTIGQPKTTTNISKYSIINDSIEFKGQVNTYTYTPTISGTYRFTFSEIQNGVKFSLGIYDSKEKEIEYYSKLGNNNGITVNLLANEKYTLKISQHSNLGKYILKVGKQKETIDISNYTQINDNIEFKDQCNIYKYTPTIDGHYYIYFNEIISGTDVHLVVKNRLGEQLKNNSYNLSNNQGVSFDLTAGEQYTIYVSQHNNYGSYQMNIGTQKETVDITPYVHIQDSIEYKTQQNNYIFIPDNSLKYKLKFKNMNKDFSIKVIVRDDLNFEVTSSYISNDKSIQFENLVIGQVYTIQVIQDSQYGEYTFSILQNQD